MRAIVIGLIIGLLYAVQSVFFPVDVKTDKVDTSLADGAYAAAKHVLVDLPEAVRMANGD